MSATSTGALPFAGRRAPPRPRAAQHGADAGGDLTGAEGLDDVVVGAELQADHAVGLVAARGQHDDRHLRLAPDLAADVVAGAVGEHQVEEDEVGAHARGRVERVRGSAGDLEVEALAGEGLGERLRDGRLVLDEEDRSPAGCHVHIVGGHRGARCLHTAAPAGGRAPRVRGARISRRRRGPAAAVAAAVVAGLTPAPWSSFTSWLGPSSAPPRRSPLPLLLSRCRCCSTAAAVVVGHAAAAGVVRSAVAAAVVVRVVARPVGGAAAAVRR